MMRTLVAAMLAALASVPASANTVTDPIVSGTVVVPAGAARAQRCARDHNVSNGTFGYVLTVIGGKLFTLTTPQPSLDDVNIGFYKTLTPCETNADVAGNYINASGNESGTVPSLATRAIIYTGSIGVPPEHVGTARANVLFTYTQTNPPP